MRAVSHVITVLVLVWIRVTSSFDGARSVKAAPPDVRWRALIKRSRLISTDQARQNLNTLMMQKTLSDIENANDKMIYRTSGSHSRRHVSTALAAMIGAAFISPKVALAAETASREELESQLQRLQLELELQQLQQKLAKMKADPAISAAKGDALASAALQEARAKMKSVYTKAKFPDTNENDLKWLAQRADAQDVKQTPGGVLYKVLRPGSGGKSPLPSTQCDCHYQGWTIGNYEKAMDKVRSGTPLEAQKGLTFDSSYARGKPIRFSPNQVIKGWTEAMQLMSQGEKWELYIPADNAYGRRGAGNDIPGGAALIFQMEIVKING